MESLVGLFPITQLNVQVTAPKRGEHNFRIPDYPPTGQSLINETAFVWMYPASPAGLRNPRGPAISNSVMLIGIRYRDHNRPIAV